MQIFIKLLKMLLKQLKMRSDNKYGILILVLMLISTGLYSRSAPQDPDKAFEIGVRYYAEGSYIEAIEHWEKLVSSGYSSYELYYNLGNANFKNGSIAGSILYYEKALLLRPFNEDVKYNLEIARSYITDNFETIPELFLSRWYKMISLIFQSNTWAIISLVLFAGALVLILVYLFSAKRKIKKISFLGGLLFLIISAFSISLSYQNTVLMIKKRNAIIFAPAVTGKSSPDDSGKDLFLIHEGTKVRIEDELGGWYEVRLSDGNVGWIPSETLTKV